MTWWESEDWRAYEVVCGVDTPRASVLACATWDTQVVDLSASEADLWKGVRKSYHSLIHAADRDEDLTWDVVNRGYFNTAEQVCRKVHEIAAGKQTRPLESWQMMDRWIRNGNGMVVYVGRRDLGTRGYAYSLIHGSWSYYHSGVTLDRNLSHALIWRSMLGLKARGVRWFELGWLARPGDTDKDRTISFFKQGFGGRPQPANDSRGYSCAS